ncbi:MAG: hypothetical protein PHT07_23575 [Paludibacter sp.]|nr:hypothetical protein [Paludibacter sp.]
MKTNNKTDLLIHLREIRDQISHEIKDMTFEQEKEYIQTQLAELKLSKHKRKLPV